MDLPTNTVRRDPNACRVPECEGTDESWMHLCQEHYNQLPCTLRTNLQQCQFANQRDRFTALITALDWIEANATQGTLF